MLQHGLIEQEVNLLRGPILVSVLIRYYWSPKLKKLANIAFKISETPQVFCSVLFWEDMKVFSNQVLDIQTGLELTLLS